MADTVIPPPDPNKPVDPTFVPAPVPSAPSTSTSTPTASPSVSGLAAPGAQPSSPAAAPGANSLAAPAIPAPNPTTAGNNMAVQGNNALQTLAQPAPLPDTMKAAAAGAGAGAAASSAAAGQAGQTQQKAQAGAQAAASSTAATTATKAAAKPKTGLDATLDILSPVMDTIKKMMDGQDPIAKIQFNNILTANGPRDQAMLQNLGLKLKQENLDGQGAGSALLAMLARDNTYNQDQLAANVSADSAKRLYDMNLHGFDKAIEIQQNQATQLRSDLTTAISNGQFDTASQLWGQVYPSVPFDMGAAKAASPTANTNFNSRMKLVDQFVSQGDATNAKAVMDKLAQDMPEMFGFPNDPAAAKASVSGIDFTTEAWQNNQKATADASSAARTAALQGDTAALSSAVDQLFGKMTPAAVEAIATSAAKTRSLDEINKILASAGMAPVASTDEASMLDKTKFAKAVKAYDLTKDANKTATDNMLDTFAKADPAIAVDPAARTAAKAWLDAHAYALANSADGTTVSLDPSKLNPGEFPPWDPASPQAYMYNSWPVATFNPDGTVNNVVLEDPTPYNSDYKPGDLTTAKGKEDARLDAAYQKYKFSTPASDLMTMKQWYFATAAGTKEANKDNIPGGLKPDAAPAKDPMQAAKDVNDALATGKALPDGAIDTIKTQLPDRVFNNAGITSLFGSDNVKTYLKIHPDGMALLNDKLVKVVGSDKISDQYGGDPVLKISYNGKTYYVLQDGGWMNSLP